uniref:Uncharacterized protein n=1 Tax=Cannabis sativa TaxID=3483 RepID=A0A803Q4J6_CANSA
MSIFMSKFNKSVKLGGNEILCKLKILVDQKDSLSLREGNDSSWYAKHKNLTCLRNHWCINCGGVVKFLKWPRRSGCVRTKEALG